MRAGRAVSAGSGRRPISATQFDAEDYELLEVVRRILEGKRKLTLLRGLFDPALHPRGIKELAAPKAVRIAHAVVDLLATLEAGRRDERIAALRAVRDEVLHNGSQSLRRNVARVLLEIMKRLVRTQDHEVAQLRLAHDFRDVMTGNPVRVREQLRRYHLLEMPEEWNQLAFDHHVHDAHSKGRKSPTHLIMDAWIKGIRTLGVVYYQYVTPDAASELLEAADIMGVQVRVGIELSAVLRDKYAFLVWAPRGFHGRKDFLAFLEEPAMKAFLAEGQEVSAFYRRCVIELLAAFNRDHLPRIAAELGLQVAPLEEQAFLDFVGVGQGTRLHLAEFVHVALLPHLQRRAAELLRERRAAKTSAARAEIDAKLAALSELSTEHIAERYVSAAANPSLPDHARPVADPSLPERMRLAPRALVDRLASLPCGFRLTLNPSNLTAEETLEVLHECGGRVSHLEIFNLKDWAEGRTAHRAEIDRLRRVLNDGNVVTIKRLLLGMLRRAKRSNAPDRAERIARLRELLADLPTVRAMYRHTRLQSRIGSDSTGRARHAPGMGLVVVPSLPRRSAVRIHHGGGRRLVPVRTGAELRVTYAARHSADPTVDEAYRALRRVPWLALLGHVRRRDWHIAANSTHLDRDGNIATLGGLPEEPDLGQSLGVRSPRRERTPRLSWRYLDTRTKNLIKLVAGFIPAFLTFYLTKSWWVLAYLGAVIWFSITGVRNVLQSVVGAGGLGRSSLLRWNDFVSWNRVADSLFYTGFSVPLLDYLVKTLLLDRTLGITAATSPLMLYVVIAVANGTYISSHNVLRGLPTAAAAGNFFRAILSIPIAWLLNAGVGALLVWRGDSELEATAMLQLWAAVISKAASDCVAAVIEGTVDRQQNLERRRDDYRDKLSQLQDTYAHIDLLVPNESVVRLLRRPRRLLALLRQRGLGPGVQLVRQLVVHALDLMYLWAYQPRAETVLRNELAQTPPEERELLRLAQRVLRRKRLISNMFLTGLVGERFDAALAFYLSRSEDYLRAFDRMLASLPRHRNGRLARVQPYEPAGVGQGGGGPDDSAKPPAVRSRQA